MPPAFFMPRYPQSAAVTEQKLPEWLTRGQEFFAETGTIQPGRRLLAPRLAGDMSAN